MICPRYRIQNHSELRQIQNRLLHRSKPDPVLKQQVQDILDQVRDNGDSALVDFSRRFDCPGYQAEHINVSSDHLSAALDFVPGQDVELIQECIANIRDFHSNQKENSWISLEDKGLLLGQLVRPVRRAGLYVPGGTAGKTPLISSLIMGVVPAQVAGVQDIVVCTPPDRNGSLNPYTLATAHLLGLPQVYALGSAWAVAAMAYGTSSVPRVDVLAGPGNTYVTMAKKLLMGEVGLDMLAGPSEILILADSQARPEWLAADMISQAEHDPWAAALLITDDPQLLERTEQALQSQLQSLPRQEAASQSLSDWGGLIQVQNLEQGLELVNMLAPEHLELCLQDPWSWLYRVQNAGAIFLGPMTPEPLGDYFAGPNHTLPTMGNARFASALSVQTFYKKSSIISSSREYMEQHATKVSRMARLEGLEGHARSVDIRFNN
ncbi:MAG: histidinol dehydrogenase [Desulfohalobiaceae bacterium]